MTRDRRYSVLLLLGGPLAVATRAQTIPNPNENRLGMPDIRPQQPAGREGRTALSREAHAQALAYTEELLSSAQQLRDNLKKAGEYVVPLSSLKQTDKIEKLAKKIREQLKS